jgi:type I restriction enzyme S subunit
MSKSIEYKISKLVALNIIAKPLDGNHGGIHPTSKDYTKSGIPFVMASDINNGKLDLTNCKFLTFEHSSKLKKGFAKEGDVLLTHKASIGRTAIVPKINVEYIVLTPQVTYYRVLDRTRLNNLYLMYYFNSFEFQNLLATFSSSGSTRAYIGITEQLNLSIKVPAVEIQKQIAEILSSLDDKIELNNKINQELENLAQTLFKQWFIDFEFPNENGEPYKSSGGEMVDSELGMIPKGWTVETLKDEFILNMGQSPKGDTYNELNEGMVFYQGRSDFGFRFPSVRMYTVDPKKMAKKFETLISVRAPVGDINMAKTDCCIGRGIGSISHSHNLFSYTYHKILSIQDELKSYDNEGTVFGSINKETLGNIKTVKPQISIALQFNGLTIDKDSLIYKLTSENEEIINLRDSLLPKLISGELEINQQLH